jgi:acyl-CoA thioester hydrolase
MTDTPQVADFPRFARDKLRYGDTDRLGHINNAVFATFLETGRVEMLFDAGERLNDRGCVFVIARLVLDFRGEIVWPGEVVIGSRLESIGRSSLRIAQAIFQGDICAASAETVIVQMDEETRKSRPFSPEAAERLAQLRKS